MSKPTPEEQVAHWADKLRDLSAWGLRFPRSIYDKEQYQKVQAIAMEMLALISGQSVEQLEPLRVPHFSRPTPLCGGNAAVINGSGEILLMQRADNSMWCMPGGMFEVGETPAEGVIRETLEETGVHCKVRSLLGIFDSSLAAVTSPFHVYAVSFLCEPVKDKPVETASFAHEALNVDWFAESDLPDPIDPRHVERIPMAFQMWRQGGEAYFDVPSGST